MAFNLTWPKVAALTTVQAAAQTAVGALVSAGSNGAVNWVHIGETSGVSALVAFLSLVVAYRIPGQLGTAALSAPAAVQQYRVADADQARAK